MTEQQIEQKRVEYENMINRGFNDYNECLRLLDIIEEQANRIKALEAEVELLPSLWGTRD